MTAAPKPRPRLPKPRKPIPRIRAKPRRAKKRPQATRTALRRKADALFSLYVRQRDGKCQRCGRVDALQCSHFVSRRYLAVRFNPLNAEALCARCHKFMTERPLEADEWARSQLGIHPYAELRRLALAGGIPDYVAVIARLEGKEVAA